MKKPLRDNLLKDTTSFHLMSLSDTFVHLFRLEHDRISVFDVTNIKQTSNVLYFVFLLHLLYFCVLRHSTSNDNYSIA